MPLQRHVPAGVAAIQTDSISGFPAISCVDSRESGITIVTVHDAVIRTLKPKVAEPRVDPKREGLAGVQPDIQVDPQVSVHSNVPIAGIVYRVLNSICAVRLQGGYPLDGIGRESIAYPHNN